jgi:hypothetical protein
MYPDRSGELAKHAKPRQRITPEDRLAAAALADHVEATFGPYDQGTEWVVAGIALSAGLKVVTAPPPLNGFYPQFDGCEAISVADLLNELG